MFFSRINESLFLYKKVFANSLDPYLPFESIFASLYYEDSDYLYYLSTPEGETIFSKTLEEHNIAKFKYLK
jgi:hypothetical protein